MKIGELNNNRAMHAQQHVARMSEMVEVPL